MFLLLCLCVFSAYVYTCGTQVASYWEWVPPPTWIHSAIHNAIFLLLLATSLDIQINIRVPDAEGILVECTSGSLIPPAEMTWRDSKGNIIPHSSKFDSQDSTGLLYLKSRILLKNRTHGPVTCSIYNETTNQEKKKSIVLPGKFLWLYSIRDEVF